MHGNRFPKEGPGRTPEPAEITPRGGDDSGTQKPTALPQAEQAASRGSLIARPGLQQRAGLAKASRSGSVAAHASPILPRPSLCRVGPTRDGERKRRRGARPKDVGAHGHGTRTLMEREPAGRERELGRDIRLEDGVTKAGGAGRRDQVALGYLEEQGADPAKAGHDRVPVGVAEGDFGTDVEESRRIRPPTRVSARARGLPSAQAPRRADLPAAGSV